MEAGPQTRDLGIETIIRLNNRLAGITSADEAFGIISEELRSIAHSDVAGIFLIEPDSTFLRPVGIAGLPKSALGKLGQIRTDENFRKSILEKNTSLTLKFSTFDELPPTAKDVARELDLGSALLTSVRYNEDLIGYFILANKTGGKPFTAEIEEVLNSISNYFAVVIQNVRTSSYLVRSIAETERILEMAPTGILTCDPKGIFLSVNKQMLAMLGCKSASELLGTSVFENSVIMKSGLDQQIAQGMEGHDGEKIDVHVVPSPDRAFYLHSKVTAIKSDNGSVERVLFVAMDTTTKVRLQNQLERSYERLTQTFQELERVTKMKSQFIDIVSHELRTPLTVLRGYIDLVESDYASKLDKKFANRLSIIKTNTDKLYGLVESMLDVSRLEKGSLQIHPEQIRVDAMLEEVIEAHRNEYMEKKQSVVLDLDQNLPLVMADRRRFKDVFKNLVDNAIKYTQEGGRIQIGGRDEGKMVHLWVKDNGTGIPLDKLGSLFETFHIITSNDLSHQVDRLGLGLPISKGIIEAHGGRIWVESQVGKGSVFHVELPKESPARSA